MKIQQTAVRVRERGSKESNRNVECDYEQLDEVITTPASPDAPDANLFPSDEF